MGETIMVLLVFFVLVLLGFIFYINVMKSNIEVKREEIKQKEAIQVAQRAMFLPELQCAFRNIEANDCVDIMKLSAAADIILENQIFYFDKLGFSKIVVNEIYPEEKSYLLYDNSLPTFQDKTTTYLPIDIFDPTLEEHAFGIMQVEVYAK